MRKSVTIVASCLCLLAGLMVWVTGSWAQPPSSTPQRSSAGTQAIRDLISEVDDAVPFGQKLVPDVIP